MMNNNFIKRIFIAIIITLILVLIFRTHESFSLPNHDFVKDNHDKTGYHTVVKVFGIESPNGESTEAYDLEFEGPKCLGTCVQEHLPNINWLNEEGTDDILKFNRENPTKGYCYRANDEEYPFLCNSEKCKLSCGQSNKLNNYDYEKDFSQCEIDENEQIGCVEKNLNIGSGHGLLNTVGCKDCVKKYMPNLKVLMDIYKTMKDQHEVCKDNSEDEQ